MSFQPAYTLHTATTAIKSPQQAITGASFDRRKQLIHIGNLRDNDTDLQLTASMKCRSYRTATILATHPRRPRCLLVKYEPGFSLYIGVS